MALRRPIDIVSLAFLLTAVFLAIGCNLLDRVPQPGATAPTSSPGDPEALAQKQFRPAAPLLSPRMAFAYTSFKSRIYVFGGLTAPNWDAATDSIEVYDPLSDTWAVHGKLPWPLSFAAAGVLGDRIYVVGGQILKRRGCPPVDVGTVLAYDPATRRLEQKGTLTDPRWGLALVPFDSGLLAVGGVQGPLGPFPPPTGRLFEPQNPRTDCPTSGDRPDMHFLTSASYIDSENVSAAPALPQGRGLAGQGVVGGVPFLTQGWVREIDHAFIDPRTTVFHRSTGRWFSSVPPDLDPAWGPASAQASPDAFIVVGGMLPTFPAGPAVEIATRNVRYITRGGDGSQPAIERGLPLLPEARGLGGAAVIADKLYVFGGLGRGDGASPSATDDMVVLRDLTAFLKAEASPPPGGQRSPSPVPNPASSSN